MLKMNLNLICETFLTAITGKTKIRAMHSLWNVLLITCVTLHCVSGFPKILSKSNTNNLIDQTTSTTTTTTSTNNESSTYVLQHENARQQQQQQVQQQLHQHQQHAVTATPKPPTIDLNDLFVSVKTTKSNHANRLDLIIKTWFQLAKQQTWFFTDAEDATYQNKTNNHLINTNCSMGHSRRALCCKMSVELDTFLNSGKKWFCHFDDDNYVNVPRLVSLLNEYNPAQDWYLGKPSVSSPLEMFADTSKPTTSDSSKIKFWFGTGGAGFCISHALALKMSPIAGGGKFITIGDTIGFPDDVAVGFVIEHLLKVPLTVVDQFHSHLEPLEYIEQDTFSDQVSFSYSKTHNQWNVIKINEKFDTKDDPTRFLSLHCRLFGNNPLCQR